MNRKPKRLSFDTTVAVKSSVQLNVPCIASFRKRQPWITPELIQIRLEYSRSRLRYCSVKSDTNRLIMGQLALLMSDVYISQRETYLHSIRTDIIEALTGDNQAKLG